MKPTTTRIYACLLLICCLTAAAQEMGYWRAASNTARTITGDITLSEEKLGINFLTFPIVRVRALTDSELSAAFDSDNTLAHSGSLYKVDISGSKKFLHKNTLCSNEDAQWIATYVSGRTLKMAFFSSQTPPLLTMEGRANASDLCGTYSYVK